MKLKVGESEKSTITAAEMEAGDIGVVLKTKEGDRAWLSDVIIKTDCGRIVSLGDGEGAEMTCEESLDGLRVLLLKPGATLTVAD